MGGYTGTWQEQPAPAGYVEIENVTDQTELRPGDELWIRYRVLDWGDWYTGYRIDQISRDIEKSDPRFFVRSYQWHDAEKEVTFKVRVRDPRDVPEQDGPDMAGIAGVVVVSAIIGAIIAAGVTWLAREVDRRGFRKTMAAAKENIDADPDLTPEQKEAAKDGLDRAAGKAALTSTGADTGRTILITVAAIVAANIVLAKVLK
jgi:hypothetical protein